MCTWKVLNFLALVRLEARLFHGESAQMAAGSQVVLTVHFITYRLGQEILLEGVLPWMWEETLLKSISIIPLLRGIAQKYTLLLAPELPTLSPAPW